MSVDHNIIDLANEWEIASMNWSTRHAKRVVQDAVLLAHNTRKSCTYLHRCLLTAFATLFNHILDVKKNVPSNNGTLDEAMNMYVFIIEEMNFLRRYIEDKLNAENFPMPNGRLRVLTSKMLQKLIDKTGDYRNIFDECKYSIYEHGSLAPLAIMQAQRIAHTGVQAYTQIQQELYRLQLHITANVRAEIANLKYLASIEPRLSETTSLAIQYLQPSVSYAGDESAEPQLVSRY